MSDLKAKGRTLSESLGSVNLVLIGDDTDINIAVASAMAPLLGYTPIHTQNIIEQLKNQSLEEFARSEGSSELGVSILDVMRMTCIRSC